MDEGRIGLHPLECAVAVETGHEEIEQDDVERAVLGSRKPLQGGEPVVRRLDRVSLFPDQPFEQPAVDDRIVDDEDAASTHDAAAIALVVTLGPSSATRRMRTWAPGPTSPSPTPAASSIIGIRRPIALDDDHDRPGSRFAVRVDPVAPDPDVARVGRREVDPDRIEVVCPTEVA